MTASEMCGKYMVIIVLQYRSNYFAGNRETTLATTVRTTNRALVLLSSSMRQKANLKLQVPVRATL
jgi:hypothetical protein